MGVALRAAALDSYCASRIVQVIDPATDRELLERCALDSVGAGRSEDGARAYVHRGRESYAETSDPRRLPALRGLAEVRQRQRRPAEAAALLDRALAIDGQAADFLQLGELRMELTDTAGAIDAFEAARALDPEAFSHHLELGVCYLAGRRFQDAGASLDRVPPEHPAYPLALFKRAQVSVLLGEADSDERVRLAWSRADSMTRPLFATERLFEGRLRINITNLDPQRIASNLYLDGSGSRLATYVHPSATLSWTVSWRASRNG